MTPRAPQVGLKPRGLFLSFLILPTLMGMIQLSALLFSLLSPSLAFPFLQTFFQTTAAPPVQSLLGHDFRDFAKGLLDEWHVPGMSVGVISMGKDGAAPRVEFVGVGTMGKGRKVDADTLFGIASNSKAFTAAAVGALVDRGLFNWTTKVSSLLPGFSLPIGVQGDASVLDILSHRTGLPRHDHSYAPGVSHKDFVSRIQHLRPSAEFREVWQYNNQMFMTAAYLVASLSSTPFTTFVTESIFKPLGMSSSTFSPDSSSTSWDHLSDSFVTLDNGTIVEIPYGFKASFEDLQVNAGAGGVVSSARDLMKWLEFLITARNSAIHPESGNSTKKSFPTSPSSVLKISEAHMLLNLRGAYPDMSSPTSYGMGLEIEQYQGSELIRHGGSIPGFGTQIVWSSEHGVGAVALCNAALSGNSVSDIVTFRAFEDLLGLKHVDWNGRYKEKKKAARALRKGKQIKLLKSTFATTSAVEKPPALPLELYLGAYVDEGYSNLTICSTSPQSDDPLACSSLHALLSGALPITDVPPPSSRPSFLIARPGYFGQTHMLITQEEGELYKGSWGAIWESPQKAGEMMVAYDYEDGEVVDVQFLLGFSEGETVVEGMEWRGVWGPGPIIKGRENEEGKSVEVVFKKV